MDLGNVMDEIATRLRTIDGLAGGRTTAYPPKKVTPPAAFVGYPESVQFDGTYRRGMDSISALPVSVVVGTVTDRAARDEIAAYTAGSGAKSVKAVLESGTYTAFDVIRVTSVEFEIHTIAGTDYLAATFNIDIKGQGS